MRMNVRSQYGREHGLSNAKVVSARNFSRMSGQKVQSRVGALVLDAGSFTAGSGALGQHCKGFGRRLLAQYAGSPNIRGQTIEGSQDEIFVMLFCRSVIQFAFMQKA